MTKQECKRRRKEYTRQFFKGNHLNLAMQLVATIAEASFGMLVAWLIQQLMDLCAGTDTGASLQELMMLCLVLLGLLVLVYGTVYIFTPRFRARAMTQYKDYVFTKISDKSISAFSRENSALYLSALSNDANTITTDYLDTISNLTMQLCQFAGALGMMFFYSPMLTAVSIGLTALPFVVSILTGGQMVKTQTAVSDRNGELMASLKDGLSGFPVVKAFRAEKAMCKLILDSIRKAEAAKCRQERVRLIINCLSNATGLIAQFGVLLFGGYLALTGRGVTPGVVIAFVQLMNYVINPIVTIPEMLSKRKAALALIDKLADALDENVTDQGRTVEAKLTDAIILTDVTFGYEENKTVLHSVSTRFEAGKSYAIVGASGSGKSTLLSLLMAGHSGYEGHIRFDGAELRDIRTDSLYDLVSLVQQNVFVFNATLRDNVTMFQRFPDADVTRAMELSGLAELVKEKGEGYLCGENGCGLSGGEKQRLSIARSLLRKSPVLLMDEATAALDAQTASTVINAVLDLGNLTRIVVTHSLDEKLLSRYDAILTLKDGRILETGSFDELMEKKGYFYSLFTVSQ